MLWFAIVAINFMLLTVLSARLPRHPLDAARALAPARMAWPVLLVTAAVSLYPCLWLYFRFYPVSRPSHFAFTMLGLMLSVVLLVWALVPRWLVLGAGRSLPAQTLRQGMGLVGLGLAANLSLRGVLASGSLLSIWLLVYLLLFVGVAWCYLSLLLGLLARLRTP